MNLSLSQNDDRINLVPLNPDHSLRKGPETQNCHVIVRVLKQTKVTKKKDYNRECELQFKHSNYVNEVFVETNANLKDKQ